MQNGNVLGNTTTLYENPEAEDEDLVEQTYECDPTDTDFPCEFYYDKEDPTKYFAVPCKCAMDGS